MITKNSKIPITLKPFTVRSSMNVQDSPDMHFMQIKSRKDGKPVGILVKKNSSMKSKKRFTRGIHEIPDDIEVIEITGVRESDNAHDKANVYRNAVIVNNKLINYQQTDQHALQIQ